MKKIEITTTQNVTIEYNLATIFERMGAFILDALILFAFNLIVGLFVINTLDFEILGTTLIVLVIFFYSLVSELFFNGQSLGKKILQIKVSKITGEKLTASDCGLRWCTRWIDLYSSSGALAIISAIASPKSQRIGDLLADTVVIKANPKDRFKLHEVLNIKTLSDYNPTFLNAKYLLESDMLLVKEVINRHQKVHNESSKKALDLLTEKIREQLDVPPPKNKIKFLTTVIKDYVVLTR